MSIKKCMKVTLVYPDEAYTRGSSGYYYHGIGYLAAVLKQRGHKVSLLHITSPINEDEFCQSLAKHLFADCKNIVAFSATTNRFAYVETWSKWTKKHFSIFTICGGIHPTLNADSAIQSLGLDAICIGEGEHALVDLCDRLQEGNDIYKIPNIWVKKDGELYKNTPRPLISDLDILPFPDRSIFNYPNLYHERQGAASVMASRGCPYDCHYCCNRAISSIYKGQRYVRFRSVDNIIGELKHIIACYPFIGRFAFDDDILMLNKSWCEQFLLEYQKQINLPFSCNVRPNLMTESITKLLKEVGCYEVHMGIESGNPTIRSQILNRHISDEQIITAIKLCKRVGIKIYTYNMVGLPHEDMKDILDTVKLNAIVHPNMAQVSIFYPYYGTELFKVCQQESLLTNRDIRDYFQDTMLSFSPIFRNKILFSALYFPLLMRIYAWVFKLSPKYQLLMTRIIDSFLISKITSILVFMPLIKIASFVARHEYLHKWIKIIRSKLY